MLTRLRVVPGGDDERAAAILRRAPARITEEFLGSLDEADRQACGRFSARMVIIALRVGSTELLADAVLADALSGVFDIDWRDSMVGLSVHFVVARELGLSPVELFDAVADRLPPGGLSRHLRSFGRSTDVTLAGYGHELVQTPDGPDLIPTGMEGRLWREAVEPPSSPLAAKGELQTLGGQVAARLGEIVGRREAGLAWLPPFLSGQRELTNTTDWTRSPWDPDSAVPAAALELPFLVLARSTRHPPHGEMVHVTVSLVDRARSRWSGAVGYTGWADLDWTARADRPADVLAVLASRMIFFDGVIADRGDITTLVAIFDHRRPHLLLGTGEGNAHTPGHRGRPPTTARPRRRDSGSPHRPAMTHPSRHVGP